MTNLGDRSARCALLVTTVFAVAVTSHLAYAQQSTHSAEPNGRGAIEAVVVTAQKRVENLQNVPISAIVVAGETLQKQNVNSLNTLTQLMPSVHVGSTASSNDFYMRGIGSGANATFDQAVGTFIDDIYYGRSRLSTSAFFDVARIEVLKGPQSTFFGNNAIAGAFNIVTRGPGKHFEAYVRALYGSYGNRVLEGAVGGPITDDFGARLAVHYDGTNGWLSNGSAGGHDPSENNYGARFTLVYNPSDDLRIRFKTDFSKDRTNGDPLGLQDTQCPPKPPFVSAGFCKVELGLGLGSTISLSKDRLTQSGGQYMSLQTQSNVLTANYTKWGDTFTSVTGFTQYRYDNALDIDGTPLFLGGASQPEHYNQFSQELRVTSPADQTVEYMFGGYFQVDHVYVDRRQILPFLSPVISSVSAFAPLVPLLPLAQDLAFQQEEHSYAGFGSVTWHITRDLSITGGARVTSVIKSLRNYTLYGTGIGNYSGITPFPGTLSAIPVSSSGLQGLASHIGLGPAGTESGRRSDSAFLPSAKVQYQVEPNIMTYFSYARGFLAGGFNGQDNTGSPANLAYKPEYVTAFELGMKSTFLDDHALLNIALFRSKYSDFQVDQSLPNGVGTIIGFITNAASVITQGVEAQGVWKATDDLEFDGDVAYDDAHYGTYTNVAQDQLGSFCLKNLANPSCIALYGAGGPPVTRNMSGEPTSFAPKWAGSLTATYRMYLDPFIITPSVTGIFSSSYFPSGSTIDDPTTQQHSYFRVDARLTLMRSDSGNWAVDFIGKNLTNQNIVTAALLWPNSSGSVLEAKEEPRNFAIQLRYYW